jgi:hypothetical protein
MMVQLEATNSVKGYARLDSRQQMAGKITLVV